MKAEIAIITKEKAEKLLSKNTENRKVSRHTLEFYKKQMLKGQWKQNGESIVIDTNGVIKDGQHRLIAVSQTGVSIVVPLITEVTPDVMDTIDTGRSRSAADVLDIHGFKNTPLIASLCKTILKETITSGSMHEVHVSHADILNYAKANKQYLYDISSESYKISSLQMEKVLTPTMIGYYLNKYGLNDNTSIFLKQITGTERESQTATDYVYKKLYLAKKGEERLSNKDKQEYIEKAYEHFMSGNPKVKYLKLTKNK